MAPTRWHITCQKCDHKIDESTQDKMWESYEAHMKEKHSRKRMKSSERL